MTVLDCLKPGSDASWLPKDEAKRGTGILCSVGWKDIDKPTHYRYLPFAPNGINYCAAAGVDVISGNFTGCIMATFTDSEGRNICHVSTGNSMDCKQEWARIQEKFKFKGVRNFKPDSGIPADLKGKALDWCYGLITSDSKCYAITTTVEKNGKRVVFAVKRVDPIQVVQGPDRMDVLQPATQPALKWS